MIRTKNENKKLKIRKQLLVSATNLVSTSGNDMSEYLEHSEG